MYVGQAAIQLKTLILAFKPGFCCLWFTRKLLECDIASIFSRHTKRFDNLNKMFEFLNVGGCYPCTFAL